MDASLAFLDSLVWENVDCPCIGIEHSKILNYGNDMITDKKDPDLGIEQLSKLSTRLSSLHRWSCIIGGGGNPGLSYQPGDSNQTGPSSLIDDATFKSVAAWLVHISVDMRVTSCANPKNSTLEPSSTRDILHNVFSASYQLIEILLRLKGGVTGSGGVPRDTLCAQDTHLVTPDNLGNPYSSIVKCHLVNACHALLQEIYLTVLIALQCDVDRLSSSLPSGDVDPATIDAVPLADMQLVLVVQICSYLIERQHQAIAFYLSPQSQPPQQPETSRSKGELDMEVQRRLARLRESLHI